jgi:hypothetical protein
LPGLTCSLQELVYTEGQDFKVVTYARATALIADAVRELRSEKDAEIAALQEELRSLRQLVERLSQLQLSGDGKTAVGQ